MALLQKDIRKLAPLVLRRVHTGGIVRASVQEEYRALRGGLQRAEKAGKVEPDSGRVVGGVGERFDADVAPDCEVVYCVWNGLQYTGETGTRGEHTPGWVA